MMERLENVDFFTFNCHTIVDLYGAQRNESSGHTQNGKALDIKPEARTLNRHWLFGLLSSVTSTLVESSGHTCRTNRSKIRNTIILRKYTDQLNVQH